MGYERKTTPAPADNCMSPKQMVYLLWLVLRTAYAKAKTCENRMEGRALIEDALEDAKAAGVPYEEKSIRAMAAEILEDVSIVARAAS